MINSFARIAWSLLILALACLTVYFFMIRDVSERHIGFNGSFVLVNQEELLGKVKKLSKQHANTEDFVASVKGLLDSESYIGSSSIRLSWPNTVLIGISEIDPIAIFNKTFLLTSTCKNFLHDGNLSKDGMLRFTSGLEVSDPYLCSRIRLISAFIDPESINSIEVLNNGNYKIKINDISYFIAGDDVGTDISRLMAVADKLSRIRHKIESVDLRYTSGGAVRLL